MLTGEHPFTGKTNQEMYRKIVSVDPEWPSYLSETALDLVKKLMCRDPKERLGANGGAAEVKAHPFFKTVDWEKLFNRQTKPPFKPAVKNDKDITNMDPLCTREQIELTPPEEKKPISDPTLEQGFAEFAYVDTEWLRQDLDQKLKTSK